jgi:hypothetical protein
MKKLYSLLLLGGAFTGLFTAAQFSHVGLAPAQFMTGQALIQNGNKPGRVTVIGKVVHVKHDPFNPMVSVRTDDGFEVKIVITRAGQNNPSLVLGNTYKITGEIISEDTIVITLPHMIKQQTNNISYYTTSMTVKNQIAYRAHAFGTDKIYAPNIPNGVYDLTIIQNERGYKQAVLP